MSGKGRRMTKEPNCVSLIYLEVGGVPGQVARLVIAED